VAVLLWFVAFWAVSPLVRAQDAPADTDPPQEAGTSEDEGRIAEREREEEALEQEIAAELSEAREGESPSDETPPSSGAAERSSSSGGTSNVFNPAISATLSLLAGGTSRTGDVDPEATGELTSGPTLQEAELRLSAIVDPYFRADITIAGNEHEIGIEEAYLSTLEIPRVTIRAGKMFANFGRHNILHTHAFPFLTAPQPWRVLLGPEGFKDPGISADVLLPLPFYAEINAQAFVGGWEPFAGSIPDDPVTPEDESVPDLRRNEDLVYLGHLKTLFEIGDSSTLELGGSYAGGRNGFGDLSQIAGADMTLKWRPLDAERYTGLEWTTEYVYLKRPGDLSNGRTGGGYTSLRYQFHQRWWVQGRASALGFPSAADEQDFRAEALMAFVPSEFSGLRLQYAFETGDRLADPVHEVFLQAIVSIGPHPAHGY